MSHDNRTKKSVVYINLRNGEQRVAANEIDVSDRLSAEGFYPADSIGTATWLRLVERLRSANGMGAACQVPPPPWVELAPITVDAAARRAVEMYATCCQYDDAPLTIKLRGRLRETRDAFLASFGYSGP